MLRYARLFLLCFLLSLIVAAPIRSAQPSSIQLTVHWHRVIRVSRTSPSLLYIATPGSKRGAPLHDPMLRAIRELGADYVRYSPCNDYPHLTIAELQPPGKHSTSWDFSYVDPMTDDAIAAIGHHPFIMNFSTIPEWMFRTPAPVSYPADPDQLFFNYEQGTELRDPTYRQVADYYARVVSWYVKGGFTDELGKWHASGHHYKIDYWEVLNEPNIEHNLSPQTYTGIYDAVVEAIHKVSPRTKFIGMVNSYPPTNSEFFDYFLDPRHHKPGVPLNAVSFHFYAGPEDSSEPLRDYPFTFFAQADEFLAVVSYLGTMRQRLSPKTLLMADEIGTGLPDDGPQWKPTYASIPASYWNLSAALYAYVFAGLAVRGVSVVNESMLPAYVGQFPDLALLNWQTGQPNARFTVLKLIRDNFQPGDKIVEASAGSGYVTAQGFVSPSGQRKVLLVNKSDKDFQINFPEAVGAMLKVVDVTTGPTRPAQTQPKTSTFNLGGFGVAALTLRN
ncbi:MAG TPA: glycosyl hydrolase family 39 [Terriglobia bacterium]|nr:glycosyl hydrolase family 39 [Terriglobia bacterium]